MKSTTLVLAGVAVFAGVFGALRANDYFAHRGSSAPVVFHEATMTTAGTPAAFEPAGGALQAAPFDFRMASKKVNPSVVSVDQYRKIARTDFWGQQRGPSVERETGQGSGVILTDDGIVVTNNHVVEGSSRVVVHLSDGRTADAKVLGTDPRSDLAVLKIETKNIVPIETAPVDSIQVGQWVLAVGNPLGFSNTVSVGVVSSLKRDLPVGEAGLVNAIQTDAAINPGNSGGALCDAQGRLIGINSAIASGTGQSVGIGFSIPIDRVKTVVQDIVKSGYVRYAGLGIARYPDEYLANPGARQEIAERTGSESIPQKGILVQQATGAASSAGLKPLDVITAIDGKPTNSFFDLNKILMAKKLGETVSVKYWSRGDSKTASVTLQELQPQRRL